MIATHRRTLRSHGGAAQLSVLSEEIILHESVDVAIPGDWLEQSVGQNERGVEYSKTVEASGAKTIAE